MKVNKRLINLSILLFDVTYRILRTADNCNAKQPAKNENKNHMELKVFLIKIH